MNHSIRLHLAQLESELGSTFEDIRTNFRRLSFIWHPDRQPSEYRQVAEEKLKKINEAYLFFEQTPEALGACSENEAVESDSQGTPSSSRYEVHPLQCPRCEGSGQVAVDVDRLGRFVNQPCPVCAGSQRILIDSRNCCRDCQGHGVRPNLHDADCEAWIDKEMLKRGWLQRHLHPIIYKQSWLRYQQEVAQCASCSGAGYFYFRQDGRKGERRRSTPIDFIINPQGSEIRRRDRRLQTSA